MLLRSNAPSPSPTPAIPVTIDLPRPLWEGLQLCTPAGGDVAAVVVEAVEHYLERAMEARQTRGHSARLVAALSRPITSLGLGPSAESLLQETACGDPHKPTGKHTLTEDTDRRFPTCF
jgi:hypothetical protein